VFFEPRRVREKSKDSGRRLSGCEQVQTAFQPARLPRRLPAFLHKLARWLVPFYLAIIFIFSFFEARKRMWARLFFFAQAIFFLSPLMESAFTFSLRFSRATGT